MKTVIATAASCLLLLAVPALAQHVHPGGATSEIKALTPEQLAEYLAGDGMGLAKAAELNRYPGPKHVLELIDSLSLSTEQLARAREMRARVVERASALGREIVEKERELDMIFAHTHATRERVTGLTAEIARLEGELRAVHLLAHLEMRAVLSPAQIETYERLRAHVR
jgi:hypothetical protein